MKLRTFTISYLVLLSVLALTVAAISSYMTNHQVTAIREQAVREYESIARALERGINAVYLREGELAVESLLRSYRMHYDNQYYSFILFDADYLDSSFEIPGHEGLTLSAEVIAQLNQTTSFEDDDEKHTVIVSGPLRSNFNFFFMQIQLDVSESIAEIRTMQTILIAIFVISALVAGIVLYLIFNKAFKPLELITRSSKRIAEGNYRERIENLSDRDLKLIADNFNLMAESVEQHVAELEGEVIKKQQFMDNFSHEIRTPLTSIHGFAQYLQRAQLSEEERIEAATRIWQESEHIQKVASSMLDLAVLRDYTPEKAPVQISELFSSVEKALKQDLVTHQAELEVITCEAELAGQKDLLRSLLLNLCTNALRASAIKSQEDIGSSGIQTKGRVCLKAVQEQGKLILSVSDNGRGIPEEDLDRIWEPFYRVDKARAKQSGGAGLGLPLVAHIAQLHSAAIEVNSIENEGTEVRVIFTNS